jgi:RimJ/RimL family protein N-acetyltransferase
MGLIAETPRLLIRTFDAAEEEAYVQLFSDARVAEHLPRRTPDENRKIFADILNDDAAGAVFSKWAIINKADNAFIGMGLLRPYNSEPDKLEVGYCLHVQYWNQGFATELVNALIAYTATYTYIKTMVAVTTPGNKPSMAVLEKAGLVNQGSIIRNNEELVFFKREL